jgi:hypothetical protein
MVRSVALAGNQWFSRAARMSTFWNDGGDSNSSALACADYGPLNGLARHHIDTDLIAIHWDDLLRIAGSLATGTVQASNLLRVLQGGGRPTPLGRAVAELGRIAKTLYLLAYLDDETYRRRILTQAQPHREPPRPRPRGLPRPTRAAAAAVPRRARRPTRSPRARRQRHCLVEQPIPRRSPQPVAGQRLRSSRRRPQTAVTPGTRPHQPLGAPPIHRSRSDPKPTQTTPRPDRP